LAQFIDQNNTQETRVQIDQMERIYASAQLTIVATMGQDPTYGLPGVHRIPRNNLRQEHAGSMALMLFPPIRGLEDVIESPWASRGWTLQEGFLSKRRLIFTDRQAIFFCNCGCCYEADTANFIQYPDKSKSVGWMPERPNHTMTMIGSDSLSRSMRHLKSYSAHNLTYDTDALNAIVGALHIYDDIYHIWGILFRQDTTIVAPELGHYFEFVLLWSYPNPSRRRHGFPSWSSIGWEGHIEWLGRVKSSSVHEILIRHTKAGTISLQCLPPTMIRGLSSSEVSQQLELLVIAADLPLINTS
jgi:hypothetical protein